MKIDKIIEGKTLFVTVEGRLDTVTSPALEAALKPDLSVVNELIFDFSELEYMSSAGLRVLLVAQKAMMSRNGSMKLRHVNETIMEIFEVTGFADILTIE